MKIIGKTDDYETPVPVFKDKSHTVGFRCKRGKDDDVSFALENVTFNYSECTWVDMMKIATKALVVQLQGQFRAAYTDDDKKPTGTPERDGPKWEKVYNVKEEFLARAKVSKTNAQKAEELLGKMSEEERLALLARFQQ